MDIEEIKAELCFLEMNTERAIMDFINQQQETIESLKCCGNCDLEDLSYEINECPHADSCSRVYIDAKDGKDYWQPIK